MALPSLREENPLMSFRKMFNDFFNDPFFATTRDLSTSNTFWPRVDIADEKERVCIRAELPGMSKDDINVTINNDILTISGEKKIERKSEQGGYNHFERSYGEFERSFRLPDYVSKEKVDANFKNGVLELSLIKTGEEKPKAKQIEIK